jgi:hypothetical protein
MTTAGSSHQKAPDASGDLIATHSIGGKAHQVVLVADDSGHIQGSLPTYFYCTPPIAVGASKLMFDLFNAAGSGRVMDIRGIWAIAKTDAAVTGVVSARYDVFRTSAVGTGGTAASVDSTTADPAGGNLTKFDENNAPIPAQITARVAPTGGATSSRWLFPVFAFPEETNVAALLLQFQNWIPMFTYGQKLVCREGQGIKVIQGSVASVNSFSFLIAFTLEA